MLVDRAPATSAWIIDPQGSGSALSEVREWLASTPDAAAIVLYFSPTVDSIADLEDWSALKNLNASRLLLHFTLRDEPQELEVNSGALDETKLAELTHAFFENTAPERYTISGNGAEALRAPALLERLGIPSERILVPRQHSAAGALPSGNGAGAPKQAADTKPPEAVAEGHCEVTVIADGRTRRFSVQEGETVLEAGERAGLSLPYSCRSAVCSTCRTRLVSGSVEMAQNYALEEWELAAGFILACQSHPTSPELTITYDEQ